MKTPSGATVGFLGYSDVHASSAADVAAPRAVIRRLKRHKYASCTIDGIR